MGRMLSHCPLWVSGGRMCGGVKKCPWAWCFSDRGWGWLCTVRAGSYCSCQLSRPVALRLGHLPPGGAPTPTPRFCRTCGVSQEPAPASTSFSVIFSALLTPAGPQMLPQFPALHWPVCKAQSFHHFLKKSQIFSYILVAHLRIQGLQGGVESRNPSAFHHPPGQLPSLSSLVQWERLSPMVLHGLSTSGPL